MRHGKVLSTKTKTRPFQSVEKKFWHYLKPVSRTSIYVFQQLCINRNLFGIAFPIYFNQGYITFNQHLAYGDSH